MPLTVDVPPSPRLFALLAAAHLLAIVAVAALPIPGFVRVIGAVLIAWNGVLTVRDHALRRAAASIVRIARHDDESWQLTQRNGVRVDATLRSGSFVHPLLLVLNFAADGGKKYSVVLVPARETTDVLRRLRAALRWGSSSAG